MKGFVHRGGAVLLFMFFGLLGWALLIYWARCYFKGESMWTR